MELVQVGILGPWICKLLKVPSWSSGCISPVWLMQYACNSFWVWRLVRVEHRVGTGMCSSQNLVLNLRKNRERREEPEVLAYTVRF